MADWSAIIAEATATVGLAGLIVKLAVDMRAARAESTAVRKQLTANGTDAMPDVLERLEIQVKNVDSHVRDVHEDTRSALNGIHAVMADHGERIRKIEGQL